MQESRKIVLAVVSRADANHITDALVAHQYSVTRMSSTGGFFRRGSVTLIVGVNESDVPSVLDVIRFACRSSSQPEQSRATIYVLNTNLFEQT